MMSIPPHLLVSIGKNLGNPKFNNGDDDETTFESIINYNYSNAQKFWILVCTIIFLIVGNGLLYIESNAPHTPYGYSFFYVVYLALSAIIDLVLCLVISIASIEQFNKWLNSLR